MRGPFKAAPTLHMRRLSGKKHLFKGRMMPYRNACRASAVTIGKDSTWRDLAQEAFRMRGIEHGQTISVLITLGVAARVRFEVPDAAHSPMAVKDASSKVPGFIAIGC